LIVVDTSALVAILLNEDGWMEYFTKIVEADRAIIGAPTKFEFLMVSKGRISESGIADADALISAHHINVVDWTAKFADVAGQAFVRFGKGQHKAALNFGDCMAYALAKSLDAPLLFKGNDFSQTDVKCAL
jgi:ribonuclease VapC